MGDDLLAFNLRDEKEGEKWKTSAEDLEEWYTKVEGGAEWLMRRWNRAQAEESRDRQEKRGAVMEDSTQPQKKRKERSRAVVPDEKRARRKREKTRAGGGGSVTALTEVREWEAECVARHMAD